VLVVMAVALHAIPPKRSPWLLTDWVEGMHLFSPSARDTC